MSNNGVGHDPRRGIPLHADWYPLDD